MNIMKLITNNLIEISVILLLIFSFCIKMNYDIENYEDEIESENPIRKNKEDIKKIKKNLSSIDNTLLINNLKNDIYDLKSKFSKEIEDNTTSIQNLENKIKQSEIQLKKELTPMTTENT